ncbi:MAG: hypothetical protein ACRYF2_00540 [Janthinobacterium lividum]
MSDFATRRIIITGIVEIYGTWIADAFARAGAKPCLAESGWSGLKRQGGSSGGRG